MGKPKYSKIEKRSPLPSVQALLQGALGEGEFSTQLFSIGFNGLVGKLKKTQKDNQATRDRKIAMVKALEAIGAPELQKCGSVEELAQRIEQQWETHKNEQATVRPEFESSLRNINARLQKAVAEVKKSTSLDKGGKGKFNLKAQREQVQVEILQLYRELRRTKFKTEAEEKAHEQLRLKLLKAFGIAIVERARAIGGEGAMANALCKTKDQIDRICTVADKPTEKSTGKQRKKRSIRPTGSEQSQIRQEAVEYYESSTAQRIKNGTYQFSPQIKSDLDEAGADSLQRKVSALHLSLIEFGRAKGVNKQIERLYTGRNNRKMKKPQIRRGQTSLLTGLPLKDDEAKEVDIKVVEAPLLYALAQALLNELRKTNPAKEPMNKGDVHAVEAYLEGAEVPNTRKNAEEKFKVFAKGNQHKVLAKCRKIVKADRARYETEGKKEARKVARIPRGEHAEVLQRAYFLYQGIQKRTKAIDMEPFFIEVARKFSGEGVSEDDTRGFLTTHCSDTQFLEGVMAGYPKSIQKPKKNRRKEKKKGGAIKKFFRNRKK